MHVNKMIALIVLLVAIGAGFFAGQAWQRFHYNDLCLDLGGGQNPGDYPVCVIEKAPAADPAPAVPN